MSAHTAHPNYAAAERIRDLLRQGPQSINAISMALNINGHTARSVLTTLCNAGGVEIVPDSSPRRYRLFVPVEKRSANLAVPRRPEPVKPLVFDMMAHMRLCEEGRRT